MPCSWNFHAQLARRVAQNRTEEGVALHLCVRTFSSRPICATTNSSQINQVQKHFIVQVMKIFHSNCCQRTGIVRQTSIVLQFRHTASCPSILSHTPLYYEMSSKTLSSAKQIIYQKIKHLQQSNSMLYLQPCKTWCQVSFRHLKCS